MNKAIKEIMDNFNFPQVRKVMTFLKWEWKEEPVTLQMLMMQALELLLELEHKEGFRSTGGFTACNEKGHYSLEFCIESWDAGDEEQIKEGGE